MKTDCASYDLKAYQLGEANAAERRAVEQHARSCEPCANELARLNFTQSALLMAAPDEELPRRIAFVSDKVFEPKWYQKLWAPLPGYMLASAAMLAGAIVFHAVWSPGAVVAPTPVAQTPLRRVLPDSAVAEMNQARMQAVVQEAVQKAVSEADARHEKRTRLVLAEVEKRYQADRDLMMAQVNASFGELTKKYNNALKWTAASADFGGTGGAR